MFAFVFVMCLALAKSHSRHFVSRVRTVTGFYPNRASPSGATEAPSISYDPHIGVVTFTRFSVRKEVEVLWGGRRGR